jgi:gamma-glutamylcyclotransferase (GGCT)/AIG2-like uncharacterized protein YtfP
MPKDPISSSVPAASAAAQPQRHVFVYGTLRRGDDNDINRFQPAPQFVGTGSVAGTMYHLGRYPGVVLGGSARVLGEVYAIDSELERQLDELEEVYPQQTDEYFKRQINVEVDGRMVDCVVYEINPRYVAQDPRVIAKGDWVLGRHI